MRFVSVCLVIVFGCVKALASDVSLGELEGFNKLHSSEEDSNEFTVVDNEESPSSEENSKEHYGHKLDMEETIKKIIVSDDAPDGKKKQQKNKKTVSVSNFDEERKEIKRVKEDLKESSETSNESDPEPGNIIGSYVLWRPYVPDYTGILQAESYYKSMTLIKEFLEGGFENDGDKDEEKLGWKDDTKQLDLPRVAALTSKNEPDLYDNIADSLNNLKETLNEVASRPEVKDNMFYILMGLTGFLMLALFNDNILKKQETRTVQDHYLLPDSGASAKLPTYEECVKADKNILVNIGNNEAFKKVDLSLPVFVVDAEKDGQTKTNIE